MGSFLIFIWSPGLGILIYDDALQLCITPILWTSILLNNVSVFQYQDDNEAKYLLLLYFRLIQIDINMNY